PLAGFLVLVTVGRRLGDPVAGWVGTAAVGGAFVVACIVLAGLIQLPADHRVVVHEYFTWFSAGGLTVPVGTLVDPLSMTMCMFVTGVSALIHLYSIGYMESDRDYTKFFIYLNLFVFSMLLLVLANNLLLTFVGWEGVGVCSYFLVAFWFERETAASAGKKAFIYNRIGDAGFLVAIFLIFEKTGTLQYESGPGGGIFGQLSHLGGGTATAAVLLLLFAATGKSAQIPLFNWLPDAMEGPTPVSALIHAATMVTAGVYLLCRLNPLLHLSADGMEVIAIIGAVTALVAATIACAQQDIKKVLAFSTISQIGYMVLAVGSGAYIAAIFLMVMHAFFKGLLFLGAGSVIHGLEDEQDLKRMGALRRYMKWTTITFTVGFLAIAGIPPLSGFWAKGDVLDNAFAHYKPLWAIGLITAVLTAYYMSRLEILAFGGEPRFDKVGPEGQPALHPPHEPPWVMRAPLVILAFFAFVGGVLNLPWVHTHDLESWLAPVFSGTLYNNGLSGAAEWALAATDTAAALIGVIVAYSLWRGAQVDKPALEPAFLQRVWYWDDFYDTIIGRPGQRLATFFAWVVDARIIDGAVNGTAHLAKLTGTAARRLQTGYARNYALGIALGMALLIGFMLSRTWWG
ncbi:MAG TPA: NADH-quinone oxidoreductase subunit L, partial [Acidimicrobiales bacterium]|nr:NADH-quinone oxidoreductase subunit L [Acidimicrobiales bacterium]